MTQQKIDYGELITGYEFAPTSFRPDGEMVTAYLSAIEGDKRIYEENKIVPPMAVAALAMAEMSASISLLSGTIHVSQELQFLGTVGINVLNQKQATVLTGETSFILPIS